MSTKKTDQDIIAEAINSLFESSKLDFDPKDPYEANRHFWTQNAKFELASGSVSNLERAAKLASHKIEHHKAARDEASLQKDSEAAKKHDLAIKQHQGVFDGIMTALDKPLRFGKK